MSCNANTLYEEETGILLLCIVNKYNTSLIFFIRTYCDRHLAEMLLALCETTIGHRYVVRKTTLITLHLSIYFCVTKLIR